RRLAGEDVGIAGMRIQCPTHITRLPMPTILLRLPFITHLPIRHTLTIDHTAITGLITLRTNQGHNRATGTGDLLTASHRDDRWEVSLAGDCASQHRP